MSSPDPVVRLLRLMTHFNIGATLATAAWVLWSGAQIVTGQIAPAYRPDEVRRLAQLRSAANANANAQAPRHAQAHETEPPMRLVPVHEARLAAQADGAPGAAAPCHPPGAATPSRGAPMREADL